MPSELIVLSDSTPAVVREFRGNYELTAPSGKKCALRRDVDFGKPTNKIKNPILYKGGAENVRFAYGVFDRYELINAIRDFETGYFMYEFQCKLVVYHNGVEHVVSEGYGSANTRESNVGNASGFDVANSKLKIAKKRAMVDAVITMAGLSSMFTQDMENDDFMAGAIEMNNAKDADVITPKQRQRIFAIGSQAGMTTENVRTWLKAEGYASAKDIKQADYDAICDKLNGVSDGNS